MRNTSGLSTNNQFKPFSERSEALAHINRKLLRMARFAAQTNDSELGKAAINMLINEIASQINDIGSDLSVWVALTDS